LCIKYIYPLVVVVTLLLYFMAMTNLLSFLSFIDLKNFNKHTHMYVCMYVLTKI
jgi:hypothetical protein